MLRDGEPNRDEEYLLNIIRVTSWLECNEKIVICSSTGRSRSPAIALAVLVKYFKLDFYNGWELVRKKVPISNINPSHIMSLKRLFLVS